MKIGNYDISLNRVNQTDVSELAKTKKGKAASTAKTGKVDQYSETSTKAFGQYFTSGGQVQISYDIVEGLYKKTVMRKVIDKMAGDATRLGYNVVCTDLDGKPHENAQIIVDDINRMMRRNVTRDMYRDRDIYGDAFLYKQVGPSRTGLSNVQDIYGINPRDLNPVITNNVLTGWQYQSTSKGTTVDLSLEEVIHVPRNPLTGKLFGDSIFEAVLQILNLILNSQVNTAVILDHFAIPLVHWQIDAKHERKKTPMSEISNFILKLKKLAVGADLVTDASIGHEIIAGDAKMVDFSGMLDKLDSYFFATVGVPGQILGMPADNLSAITRQLQTYYENIFDMQGTCADYLIYDLYWPEVLAAGGNEDVGKIDVVFNKPLIEQESRVIGWVKDAIALDLITLEQGALILGMQGPIPTKSNNMDWLLGNNPANATAQPQFDKKQTQKTPPGTSPSGSGTNPVKKQAPGAKK